MEDMANPYPRIVGFVGPKIPYQFKVWVDVQLENWSDHIDRWIRHIHTGTISSTDISPQRGVSFRRSNVMLCISSHERALGA